MRRFDVRFLTVDGRELVRTVEGGCWQPHERMSDESYDLRHGVAVAGLVDAHTHLTAPDIDSMVGGTEEPDLLVRTHAAQHVDAGVLLVADKGSRLDTPLDVSGVEPHRRPLVHHAGAMVCVPGGYYEDFCRELDADEVANPGWIEEVTTPGSTWLKLVGDWPRKGEGVLSNFTRDELSDIVGAAHLRGLRVAIHAAGPSASDAVAAGVDSIEHGLFLTGDDLAALGARGGAWVPTIAAMEGLRDTMRDGSSGQRMLGEGLDNVRELLPLAAGLGVTVLAGTDLYVAHGEIAKEAQRLHAYGLDPAATVHAVTSAGYGYLGTSDDFSAGQEADLVVFRGDPRADVALLGDPMFIMRAGVVVHVA